MKPGEYRKQFGIPRSQSLTAKNFSEARRQMANDRGLADTLAKARAVRASNKSAVKSNSKAASKAATPKAKVKGRKAP